MSERPPPDAYSRVTDPQRYGGLHATLDELVEGLTRDFVVGRVDGPHADPELVDRSGDSLRAVRLSPADSAAAPIAASWTAFPGVQLRLGRHHIASFPSCGCDACDEDPETLRVDLVRQITAVVEGRFQEWVEGSRIGHAFDFADGHSSGWFLDVRGSPAREHTELNWKPWPRRPSVRSR